MSENTQDTSEKIGRLVRDRIPEKYPSRQYSQVFENTLSAYARLRIWEIGRDVAKAKAQEELVHALAEMLELVAALATIENIDIQEIQRMAEILLLGDGGYAQGYIVIETVVHPARPLSGPLEFTLGGTDEEA